MKKSLLTALFIGALVSTQAQIVPAPSPLAKVHQTVGLTNIEVEYSRPSLKGRSFLVDVVEPKKLWRTGANMATKVTFDRDLNFGGVNVKAGEYALFTIPSKDNVAVILNADANQGGTGSYDASKNVAEVNSSMKSSGILIESMRFTFEDLTAESVSLVWAWDKYEFRVPIKVSTQEAAVSNIKEKLEEIESRYSFYNQAAGYYLDSKIDNKQALEWALQSVSLSEKFWNTHTLAKAYLANGDKKNAEKMAQNSLRLSKEADYQAYITMNEELLKTINKK